MNATTNRNLESEHAAMAFWDRRDWRGRLWLLAGFQAWNIKGVKNNDCYKTHSSHTFPQISSIFDDGNPGLVNTQLID